MTITINDEQVDFTLEGNEKASDIYNSVSLFLKESDYMIYSFIIDGRETDPLQSDAWKDIEASVIEKIEITALTEKEYRLSGLLTIAEYVNLLLRAVSENSTPALSDLLSEYPSISNNIPVLINGERGMLIKKSFDSLMEKSGVKNGQVADGYKEIFAGEIGKITSLINSAAREIEDPVTELKSSIIVLDKMIPELNEVSILLQTGKDQKAMALIITLTEVLQRTMGLFSVFNTDNVTIGEMSYNQFSSELNDILKELADAFDSKDSVLIGDLLEYEISPKLEMLSDLQESIKDMEEK